MSARGIQRALLALIVAAGIVRYPPTRPALAHQLDVGVPDPDLGDAALLRALELPKGPERIARLLRLASAFRASHPARAAVAYRIVANEASGRTALDARFEYARTLLVLGELVAADREFNLYSALTTSPPYLQQSFHHRIWINVHLGRRETAMSLAHQYLARFPNGAYARDARLVLR